MDAEATIAAFFEAWGRDHASFVDSFAAYLADNVFWENVGINVLHGQEASVAFMRTFFAKLPIDVCRVEIRNILSRGDVVLVERLEHFLDAEGREMLQLCVMASFRVAGGKIVHWRDYLDSAYWEKAEAARKAADPVAPA